MIFIFWRGLGGGGVGEEVQYQIQCTRKKKPNNNNIAFRALFKSYFQYAININFLI